MVAPLIASGLPGEHHPTARLLHRRAVGTAARFRPFGRLQDTHRIFLPAPSFDRPLARDHASLHPQIWPLQTTPMSPIRASLGILLSRIFAPMSPTPSKTMAALWMAGWLSMMLIMAIAGRETTRELNVFQIMEVRSLVGFLLLSPIIYRAGGLNVLRTSRLPQHVARNLIHYVAQLGWFFALTLIPIGQVVAIEFTMPIWTALLAASFLSERMTPWKIAAIVLGLVGVIVIVWPATGEINPGQLIALGAAMGFGVSMALVKSLTRTESALSILF
jgi:drug/metabolite transporter (DMT)-like permease